MTTDITEAEALALATHRHYKGGLYRVVGTAKHSETLEPMVVYEHLWPHERGLWVRPAEMFHGLLEDGTVRFKAL
ncbi:DUF1653 domain-containing protein [Pararobbsia alpina]